MQAVNILIIGNCGVGKTYIMQNLIKKWDCNTPKAIGQLKYNTNGWLNISGVYDGGIFQGSDKLSMSVMQSVPEYLNIVKGVSIFEGDRFTNKNFIKLAKPYIIKINGSGKQGREQRGSSQTQRQIESIATRVNNINYDFSFDDSKLALIYLIQLFLNNNNIELITTNLDKQKNNYNPKQQQLF